ncbi:GFA family protein [Pseudooceanicola algae]|uniref:Uncharacterized protein n=1 Tax=Pseudooceanicola algae TaxID=1537215 RepID=A0A418SC08_9RHOB|nr:GFA family protein [Pseudooceanicola algae]QPM89904.1 hypothetical protein PSAL_011330 [Pseudooceanicola algae]
MTLWQGACHCQAVRFEVTAEITHLRVCNCSICHMRGALNIRVPRAALQLLTPWEGLSPYRWGGGTARDYFCPTCGIMPFRRPSDPTAAERAAGVPPFDGWAVNARCLDGFDIGSVPLRAIDGAAI